MKPVTIYALSDPETDKIRYVGKTIQPLYRRLSQHIADAKRGTDTHTSRWILNLLAQDLRPDMVVIEITDEDAWEAREQFHIATLHKEGYDLTNHQRGGGSGGPSGSAINREAISERMMGNKFACGPQSETTRQKKSAAWKGRTNNPGLGGWNKGIHKFSVDEAQNLRAKGLTYDTIAERLGVSRTAVRNALTREV